MASDTEQTIARTGILIGALFTILTVAGPLAFDVSPLLWRGMVSIDLLVLIASGSLWTHARLVRRTKRAELNTNLLVAGAVALMAASLWVCVTAPFPVDYARMSYEFLSNKPRTKVESPAREPSILTLYMAQQVHGANSYDWASVKLLHGTDVVGEYRFFYRVFYDFDSKSKFISYYLPEFTNGVEMALNWIAQHNSGYLDKAELPFDEKGNGDSEIVHSSEFPFSGRVFIYYEPPLTLEQMTQATKAFRANGAQVQFRGPDYAAIVWNSMLAHHQPSLPMYRTRAYNIETIPNSGTIMGLQERIIWACAGASRTAKVCNHLPLGTERRRLP
jgi:hypothetical protein